MSYQGSLDGLCGPYAVVNAFTNLGFEDSEALFQASCSAIKRWPVALWEGTDFSTMKRMVRSAKRSVSSTPNVKIEFPFERSPPRSNEMFWSRFDQLIRSIDFSQEKAVLILGLSEPSAHWIVAECTGRRMHFTDSSPTDRLKTKYRSSLYAGKRTRIKNGWVISPSEIVLLRRNLAI